VRFLVGSKATLCNPGDNWCISRDKAHGTEALQDSVLIEVFSIGGGGLFAGGRVFYYSASNVLSIR